MSASKSSANLGLNSFVAPPDSIDSISRIFLHRAQGESTMISAASLMKPRHLCLSGMFPCIIKYLAVDKYSRQIPQVPSVCWAAAKLLSLCMSIPTSRCKAPGRSGLSFPCLPMALSELPPLQTCTVHCSQRAVQADIPRDPFLPRAAAWAKPQPAFGAALKRESLMNMLRGQMDHIPPGFITDLCSVQRKWSTISVL